MDNDDLAKLSHHYDPPFSIGFAALAAGMMAAELWGILCDWWSMRRRGRLC